MLRQGSRRNRFVKQVALISTLDKKPVHFRDQDSVVVAFEQFESVAGLDRPFLLHGKVETAAATQEKLKTGEFRVPRETFLMAAAKSLSEQSELFTGTKLDQPNRLKMLSQEALAALAAIPPTKETKALTEKIQARLRKARLT